MPGFPGPRGLHPPRKHESDRSPDYRAEYERHDDDAPLSIRTSRHLFHGFLQNIRRYGLCRLFDCCVHAASFVVTGQAKLLM